MTVLPITPLSRRAVLAAMLGPAFAVTACGAAGGSTAGSTAGSTVGSPGGPTGTATPAGFPVTVPHAFGTTTIPAAPARVVTWGWGSADAAIALGVVPVAIPKQTYGGDADGVLPWIRERLERDGTALPTILPDAQEAPVEAIAAARPDVILAPYSGITKAEYDKLSRVAPTVAYPEQPWSTPWRDVVTTVGAVLGRAAAASALLGEVDAAVSAAAAAHPALKGASVALVFPTAQEFYVYKPADSRVAFTLDLGLTSAPSVEKLATGDESFFYTLSTERLDELTSDVLVVYADSQQALDEFLASPQAKLMRQVQRGAVAGVVGTARVAAVSPPTALSLTWGLDPYVTALAKAAGASGAAGA